MASLCLAACFFVGIHLFVAGTSFRDRVVSALGERGYLALFSLASAVGIVWMSLAYGVAASESTILWALPASWRPLITLSVGFAFLFVVVGLTTPSPTATGGEGQLEKAQAVTGILRITRHPFLMGVALWAATHLLANGDTASLVFFGALLGLAAAGPVSIDRKRARKHGEAWSPFAEGTSILPFAAIAAGRNRLELSEIGLWRPALAIAAYAVVLYFHASVFGVSAL